MNKQERQIVATFVLRELKRNFKLANVSTTIIDKTYIFETEEDWNISIPEKMYYRKLHVKGINFKETNNFVEQSIINGIRKYLASVGKEGTVTVQ